MREEHLIRGTATIESGEPLGEGTVEIYRPGTTEPIAKAETDRDGHFAVRLGDGIDGDTTLHLTVRDAAGRLVPDASPIPVVAAKRTADVHVRLPRLPRLMPGRERIQPTLRIANVPLDAAVVRESDPTIVLDVAHALVDPDVAKDTLHRVETLSPELVRSLRQEGMNCLSPHLRVINDLIRIKRIPREVALEVDDILSMRAFGYGTATYDCPNFTITYQTDGPAAVDPDTSAQDVVDPGTSNVIGTLPAGDPPSYIKRICFWLERALAAYTSPPFSLRNPAAGGRIPVVVNSAPYGSADVGVFYLNNALGDDVLCAVAVHELFHMVQFGYAGWDGPGAWAWSMLEGGATWAEDSAAEALNRYLYEAGSPTWSGVGVLVQPQRSLESAGYDAALLWRYIAEQQSPNIGAASEPKIGVETYRALIERCEAGSWSGDDLKAAIRDLPWYQDFYDFWYLDPARLDRTSSETTLGNYALACYLKDVGINQPDRRFDFTEDEENIAFDEAVGLPAMSTVPAVTLAGTGTLTTGSSLTFSDTLNRFGSRYYEVSIDPAVTNVQVQFSASAGLTSRIFQIALIDEDNTVRDIHRSDAASYTKRFVNVRDGKRLSRIALVATGAASSGPVTISVTPAAPAPDVMVTRWHSVVRTEYEIDSRNYAWHWVSPDIWVDNNGDGLADDQVFFNTDNRLTVRLHNKGNADAAGIAVEFFYQDAANGLQDSEWLPVQDTSGAVQTLSGLTLPQGASDTWSVDWAPAPSGGSTHFCVKAVVTVPGDPNSDNKRVLSNFGNVVVPFGGSIDIRMLRRNIFDVPRDVELMAVPRLTPDLRIAPRDLLHRTLPLKAAETAVDAIRLIHRPLVAAAVHDHAAGPADGPGYHHAPEPPAVDPRTVPPGVAGKPLVTFVNLVGGVPIGGTTFAVTVAADRDGATSGGPGPEAAS